MANPLRGELDFVQDGATYTLVLDVNALCEAEQLLGLKTHELHANLTGPLHMAALRGLLWAGLKAHHDFTVAEAGKMLGKLGIGRSAKLMLDAMALAFPAPPKKKARRARAGRGTGASSTGAG